MKKFVAIFVFTILFSLSFAEFIEEVDILVVDAKNRSVEGAEIWADYQLNSIKGFVTTDRQLTDRYGLLHLRLINTEYQEALTEYEYTLYVEYAGQQQTMKIDARSGRRSRTFFLDLYQVAVRIYDEYAGGLKANVTLLGQTKETSENGYAFFSAPVGEHEIVINYHGSILREPISVSDDVYLEVPLTTYHLDVYIVDDNGESLDGTVYIAESFWGTEDGKAETIFMATPPVLVKVVSESRESIVEVDPRSKTEITVPIDIHGPKINNVDYKKTATGYEISSNIYDSGLYASGLDIEDFPPKIEYTITEQNEKKSERAASLVYQAGDVYSIDLTNIPDNSIIDYEIIAKDNQGNEAFYIGTFVAEPKHVINGEPKPPGPDGPGLRPEPGIGGFQLDEIFKWVLIAIGIFVVILIIYAVFKLKREMGD